MKKSWTRLIPKGLSPEETEARFNYMFMAHHGNAEEMITDKNGNPVAAVYFTPQAYRRIEIKEFLRELRESFLLRGDE